MNDVLVAFEGSRKPTWLAEVSSFFFATNYNLPSAGIIIEGSVYN